jgi:hypothetical protein
MHIVSCFGGFVLREPNRFARTSYPLQTPKQQHSPYQIYMLSRRSLQAGTTIALSRNVLPSSGNINGYMYSTKNELQRTVICQGFCSRWSSSSSTRWKSRQGKDFFAREARVQGLKSRAAFKLLEVGLLKWNDGSETEEVFRLTLSTRYSRKARLLLI